MDSLQEPIPSPDFVWQPRPKFQDRVWLHVLLLILTIATTTFAGVGHYLGYQADFLPAGTPGLSLALAAKGLWYSVTILAILGCHELGHYLGLDEGDLERRGLG